MYTQYIQNFGLGVFFPGSRNRIRPTADRYSPPTCRPPLTNRIPRSTACRAVSGTGCLVVGRGRWRCSADVIPMLHDHLQGSVSDSRLYGTDHEPCHCSTPVRSRKPFSPHGLVGPTSHWRSRGALAESGRSHQHPTLRPTMKHIRLSRAWHRPRASPLPYAGPIVQDTLSSWPRGPDSTMALGGRREGVV